MRRKLTAIGMTTLALFVLCAFAPPVTEKAHYYMTLASDLPATTGTTSTSDEMDAYNQSYVIMDQTQQYEVNMINEMNSLRMSSGQAPLVVDPELMNAAAIRCSEISVSYSHIRPNNTDCFTAYPASYGWAGENIAYGYQTPEEVIYAWATSTGHLANMTKPQYTSVGVGVYTAPDGTSYWVQCFGGK